MSSSYRELRIMCFLVKWKSYLNEEVTLTSFAIITPSYSKDFECCRLLVRSTRKYVDSNIKHYLIVPKRDYELFKELSSEQVIILFQDDFMPAWMHSLFFTSSWWFSWKTFPVRGWIRQQIVKLSAAHACKEDYLLFMDSDCFFLKPFEAEKLLDEQGRAPLFREEIREIDRYRAWYQGAQNILGIEQPVAYNINYVGPFIIWSRDRLQGLLERIEQVNRRSWQEVICRQVEFSEYTLYGAYVEYLCPENSSHYFDSTIRTLNYWPETPASLEELDKLKQSFSKEHYGGMVSAKSHTPLKYIEKVFDLGT